MDQQNPYFLTYQCQMHKVKDIACKQHLFSMASNLAHVHNLFGLMISDIIKFMGTLPFDQAYLYNHDQKSPLPQSYQSNPKAQNSQSLPNKKVIKPVKQKKYVRQQIQITLNKDNQNKLKENDEFPEYLFETEQKTKKQIIEAHFFTGFRTEVFQNADQEFPQMQNKIIQRKSSKDYKQSKSENCEIAGNNQNRKKITFRKNFDEINQNTFDDDNIYNVNVKKAQDLQKNTKKQIQRSSLLDPFDRPSQKYDQFPMIANSGYSNNYDVQIDKPYSQRQQPNYDCNNMFKKIQKNLHSPRIKKEKPVENSKNNRFQTSLNVFDITKQKNFVQTNIFQVQEDIDEIQSSQKKIFNKVIENRKNMSKKEFRSDDIEYIPRRQEKGRKKSDREGLKGSSCPDCKAFYDAVSQGNQRLKDMCECSSRHKSTTTFMVKHKVENYSQNFQLD